MEYGERWQRREQGWIGGRMSTYFCDRTLYVTWRFHLKLLLAFAAWNLMAIPALPIYAELVVPTVQALLNLIEPHGARFAFDAEFPSITWQVAHETERFEHLLSFRLLAYNLVL